MGFNDPQRQKVDGKTCTSLHAEVACLRNVKNPKKFRILVVNIGENGKLKNSTPCYYCKKYLEERGVTSIYCSMDNGKIEKIKIKDIHPRKTQAQIRHEKRIRCSC